MVCPKNLGTLFQVSFSHNNIVSQHVIIEYFKTFCNTLEFWCHCFYIWCTIDINNMKILMILTTNFNKKYVWHLLKKFIIYMNSKTHTPKICCLIKPHKRTRSLKINIFEWVKSIISYLIYSTQVYLICMKFKLCKSKERFLSDFMLNYLRKW